MRCQILAQPGRFELGKISEPTPAAGEVTINVAAVAICGSDLSAFRGTHVAIRPPTVLGHEFSGVVRGVGVGVEGLAPGDPVCVDPTSGCGTCRHCLRGLNNICDQYSNMGRNLSSPGGMAGIVRVPEDRVHRLPPRMDLETAALVQPLSVGYHAAVHRGRVTEGDVVLISGGGAIGQAILMAAKERGAKVILTDMVASRRQLAYVIGADVVLNPASDNVAAAVAAETDGYGVDVGFEAVGGSNDAVLLELVDLTARGGTVVVVGLKTDVARIAIRELKYTEKTITGSQAHPDSFPSVIERIGDGRFPAHLLISHRFPFADVAAAFEILDSGADGVMKIVLTPDAP